MSSIYLHIPYCKQKCHYCNFFTVISKKNKDYLVNAICKEIELKKDFLHSKNINTVYFGGGTPTLLDNKDFDKIFTSLHNSFDISNSAEITIEANPDDLVFDKLSFLRDIGINRVSIGIQSFNDNILVRLNRVHTAREALDSIYLSQKLGFSNINIDLIYGIPDMNLKIWEDNLNIFLNLNIPHLSAYSLTVEEKTTLHYLIRKNKYPKPLDSESVEQFNFLHDFIDENNYEQYEISNFAKNKQYSRHNTNYWQNLPYLGLGPSAHSFNVKSRQWNVYSVSQYIKDIESRKHFHENEILTLKDNYNEYVMLGLRTKWGVDKKFIKNNFGEYYLNHFETGLLKQDVAEFVNIDNSNVRLNKRGKNYADRVASNLFII
jgi:oxygen-independent coproporphyrinogen-3 oxidase